MGRIEKLKLDRVITISDNGKRGEVFQIMPDGSRHGILKVEALDFIGVSEKLYGYGTVPKNVSINEECETYF